MSKSYFLSEQKIRQLNFGETKKLQPHLMPLCSSRSMTTFDTIAQFVLPSLGLPHNTPSRSLNSTFPARTVRCFNRPHHCTNINHARVQLQQAPAEVCIIQVSQLTLHFPLYLLFRSLFSKSLPPLRLTWKLQHVTSSNAHHENMLAFDMLAQIVLPFLGRQHNPAHPYSNLKSISCTILNCSLLQPT